MVWPHRPAGNDTDTDAAASRSVIITCAGSGIGRAAALSFAREGARVLVAYLNAETANAAVDKIRAAGGTAVSGT